MEELPGPGYAMKKLHLEMSMLHQEMSLENDHILGVFLKTEETALQYPRKQSKIKTNNQRPWHLSKFTLRGSVDFLFENHGIENVPRGTYVKNRKKRECSTWNILGKMIVDE